MRDIQIRLKTLTDSFIMGRYRLGHQILVIRANPEGMYGPRPMDYLYSQLGRGRCTVNGMIYLAVRFTETQMFDLLALRHPVTGDGLIWTNLVSLARVREWAIVLDLARRTVAEAWSTKTLEWHVIRSRGGRRSAGGRRPKAHGTFEDMVDDVTRKALAFVNSAECAWLPADGGLEDLRAHEIGAGVPPIPDPATAVEVALDALAALEIRCRTVRQVLCGLVPLVPRPPAPVTPVDCATAGAA